MCSVVVSEGLLRDTEAKQAFEAGPAAPLSAVCGGKRVLAALQPPPARGRQSRRPRSPSPKAGAASIDSSAGHTSSLAVAGGPAGPTSGMAPALTSAGLLGTANSLSLSLSLSSGSNAFARRASLSPGRALAASEESNTGLVSEFLTMLTGCKDMSGQRPGVALAVSEQHSQQVFEVQRLAEVKTVPVAPPPPLDILTLGYTLCSGYVPPGGLPPLVPRLTDRPRQLRRRGGCDGQVIYL